MKREGRRLRWRLTLLSDRFRLRGGARTDGGGGHNQYAIKIHKIVNVLEDKSTPMWIMIHRRTNLKRSCQGAAAQRLTD